MKPVLHLPALACALLVAGCETETIIDTKIVQGTAADHGKALFSDPAASPSTLNQFACATCHLAEADSADHRILPGAVLAGSPDRPSFWAGQENDLLRSINACRTFFMSAQEGWTGEEEDAKAVYAYLTSLKGGSKEAAPFTVVGSIAEPPKGNADAGADVYERACLSCHGSAKTGEGRLTETAPILPDETVAEHDYLTFDERRLVFVEKARHGSFLGYSGSMPPFSKEALSDEQLGDLLAFFGLY